MYRSTERPAIQSAYTGAFGGLLWYSQGTGGVDTPPLKAPLPAYHLIIFLLKIIHLRTSIAIRRSTGHHFRNEPVQRQIIPLKQAGTLSARCSR